MGKAIIARKAGKPDHILIASPRLATVRSDKDLHFTGALAKNESEQENLTRLETNKILIKGISIQAKQQLRYKLHLFSKDTFTDSDLDVDSLVGEVGLDLTKYGRLLRYDTGETTGSLGPILDSVKYSPTASYWCRMFHVSGDIYLIGDRTVGNDTYVYTVSINYLGVIANIDSLMLYDAAVIVGSPPGGFAHVAGDIYAVSYITGTRVVVSTFDCDSNGNLGSIISTIELCNEPANLSFLPDIVHVDKDIFLVDYTDDANDGWMATIRIATNGTIYPSTLDTWEWEPTLGYQPTLLYVNSSSFLHIAGYDANRGHIQQISIDNDGNISAIASYLIFEQISFQGGDVIHVSGDVYAVFYQDGDSDGWVKTIICDFVNIPSLIDAWEFAPDTTISWPRVAEVCENLNHTGKIFCVVCGAYGGVEAQVKTIEILNDGIISKSIIDSLIINPSYALNPDIIKVTDEVYAVAARSGPAYNEGTAYTFNVNEVGERYQLSLKNINLPYEDLDKTKELHIALKNLSPTSKYTGTHGEVVAEIKYEPAA